MREQARDSLGGLDLDLVCRIDAVCRRFEADYHAGKSPMIADYLDEIPEAGRSALRSELIGLEQEMRQCDPGGLGHHHPHSDADDHLVKPGGYHIRHGSQLCTA